MKIWGARLTIWQMFLILLGILSIKNINKKPFDYYGNYLDKIRKGGQY